MVKKMDIFIEYMIKKQRDVKDNLVVAGTVVLALILTVVLFVLMMAMVSSGVNIASSIGLLLIAGVWYGAYILKNSRSIEYEYILTNNYFDVDKIMAKKGRKRLLSIDFSEASTVANIKDNDHNHAYKNNNGAGKVMDLTGNKLIGDVYYIDTQVEGERKLILFQPTSKMLDSIRKSNPRNVFIYES